MIIKGGNNKFYLMIKNFSLYLLVIFFSIFLSVPIKFFSQITIFPNIASIILFYFLIIKQEKINYFSIFILGLLFDIFNSLPLGSTSLIWLITSKFINVLRVHLYTPDNFITTIRDFTIFAFLNSFIQWIIFSLLYKIYFPISNSIIQFILNIIFFAILYKILKKIEGWLT